MTAGGWRLGRRLISTPVRLYRVLVVTALAVLTILGTSQSSIGVRSLRTNPDQLPPGTLLPFFRNIRSDEWARWTPWDIGIINSGGTGFSSPLAFPDVSLLMPQISSPGEALLFADHIPLYLGQWLPSSWMYALEWWVPIFAVLLIMPAWLARIGVRHRFGIPAALLLVLAPSTAWWSNLPVRQAMWPLIAAWCLMVAHRQLQRRRRWSAALLLGIAGIGMFRCATGYIPWSLTAAVVFLVPTAVWLLTVPGQWRRGVAILAGGVATTVAITGVYLLANVGQLETLASTVYPGQRRSVGEALPLYRIFGAPGLWPMQGDTDPLVGNKSELSSGYSIVAIAGLLLLPAIRVGRRQAWLIGSSVAVTGILSLWVLVDWPARASAVFVPLNLIPPERVAQVLGMAALVSFALMLSAFAGSEVERGTRIRSSVTVVVACFFVTAYSVSQLSDGVLANLKEPSVILTAIVAAFVIALSIWFSDRWFAAVPMIVAALVCVIAVNPLISGFGDLTGGPAAERIRSLNATLTSGQYWASDSYISIDPLLMANAIPSLSGQQWVGPNPSAWRRLDPTGARESVWNRGTSYIVFRWERKETPLQIGTPKSADMIEISATPCDPLLKSVGLGMVVSRQPLPGTCLQPEGTMSFGGSVFHLYRVR